MRSSTRLLIAFSVVSLPALAACVAQNGPAVSPDFDGGTFGEDTGAPPPTCIGITGLTCVDAGPPDAGHDAGPLPEASADATPVDANEPDTSVPDANDANADANPADANLADTSVSDAADAALSPAVVTISNGPTFDYGGVAVGGSATQTFTLTNAGQSTATSLGDSSLGAPFAFAGGAYPGTGGSCGSTLAGGGQTCTIVVTFSPSATGLATGEIAVGYFDGFASQSATLAIQGTGLTPAVLAITGGPTIDLGPIVDGSPALYTTITISNTGGATATSISPSALSGEFAYAGGAYPGTGGTCGASLAGGANCKVVVTFTPTTPGAVSNTLGFGYGNGVATVSASATIEATGIAPAVLTFSTSSPFDYLTQVDGTQTDQSFTITNTGENAAASVSIGALGAPFTQKSTTCPTTLASTQSCDVVVTFSPTSPVFSTATLSITYNDGLTNQDATLAIQGTGETPALVTISDGPTYNYGTDTDGTVNPHTFVISNAGQAPATATVFGSLSAPFSVASTTCPTAPPTLAGGANCNVVVDFSPTAQTTSNATISIGYNDGVSAQSATRAITGTGAPPQCAVDIVGNHYLRASGTVIEVNGSINTEIVYASSGLPLDSVTQIFANAYSACALRTDGTVWCWATFSSGNNSDGELGNGTLTDVSTVYSATQVEVSAPDGGPVVYLDNVTSLPTGSNIGSGGIGTPGECAIRNDKTLWCWGPATEGDLWQGTTGSTADLAFATQMVVTADGGTDAGDADGGSSANFLNVDQVSMGNRHACYLSAGQVYCWGNNTSGELGTGDTTTEMNPYHVTSGLPSSVTSVSAGEDQTCVLAGGEVFCWGADTYTSNGNPYVTHQICNSNYCNPLPVPVQVSLSDGGVPPDDAGAADPFPLTGMQTLYSGDGYICAYDSAGTLYCWGQASGTPTIVTVATPFVSPQSSQGIPSGPIAHLSSQGGGYGVAPSALRYITTSGVLVDGYPVVTQICP